MSTINDFSAGLSEKTPKVILGAIVLFVLSLLSLEYFFRSPLPSKIPLSVSLRHSRDLFTKVTHDVMQIRGKKNPQQNLYFLGGSSIAYAIHPKEFSALVNHKERVDLSVYNFGIGRQSLIESLSILDNLPDQSGTVILGVNPRIMSRRNKLKYERWRQNHLLIRSPSANRFMEENGMKDYMVSYLFPRVVWRVKHHVWLHRNSLMRGIVPDTSYEPSWYAREELGAKRKQKKIEGFIARSENRYKRNSRLNRKAMTAIIDLAIKKGIQPVILELPLNPRVVKGFSDEFWKTYRSDIESIVSQTNVPYIDENEFLELGDQDFIDGVHVLAHARKTIQKTVANALLHLSPKKFGRAFARNG